MWGRRREIQGSSWLVRYCNQNGESVLQRENYRRNKVGRLAGQSWERDTCCEFELAPYLPGGMKEQTFTSCTLISTSTLCHVHMCSCVFTDTHTHIHHICSHKHTRNLNMLHSMSNLTHMIFKTADPLHHPITITDKGKLFDT